MQPSNTENSPKPTVKYFTIPGDLLMDILYILLENGLRYQIKAINRDENSILLYLPHERQPVQWAMAVENVESILRDYSYYLSSVPRKSFLEEDKL